MYDRRKSIGASDAVHIHAGLWAELYDWKRDPASEPSDYALAAAIGKALEPFHREWFTQETGIPVYCEAGWDLAPVQHADYPWCVYLPDGLVDPQHNDEFHEYTIPWEGKALNMMWQAEAVLRKYMPQLQHAMRVMSAKYCHFSLLRLNVEWHHWKIPYDPPYDDALLEKEKLFLWYLENEIRPPQRKGGKIRGKWV